MLTPAIMVNVVFGLTYGLKVFDVIYALTNGGPGRMTEVVATAIFSEIGSGNLAMASALSTLQFLLLCVRRLLRDRAMLKRAVKRERKKQVYGFFKQLIALILCAVVLVPFAIIVVNALKTSGEAKLMRLTWPSTGVQWENFQKVIDRGNLISAFFNSASYAIIGTGLSVILGAAAAFVLSRRKSP
jgi:ABC-type sugar transport system permease subunit